MGNENVTSTELACTKHKCQCNKHFIWIVFDPPLKWVNWSKEIIDVLTHTCRRVLNHITHSFEREKERQKKKSCDFQNINAVHAVHLKCVFILQFCSISVLNQDSSPFQFSSQHIKLMNHSWICFMLTHCRCSLFHCFLVRFWVGCFRLCHSNKSYIATCVLVCAFVFTWRYFID